jgi:hypothetical protein
LYLAALALRAMNLLAIMFFDGQDFGKFLAALTARIFVEGHNFFGVIGSLL